MTRVVETRVYHESTPEQVMLSERLNALDKTMCLFRDLRLGALLIAPEATLAFARDVFRRVNTMGKPFSEEDVFKALNRSIP